MKKQEFIKKLDIYMIIMRKKLINESEKCTELNKIITSFKHKLQERRKIPVEVIKLMLQWVKVANKLDSQIVSQLDNRLISSVNWNF